jgi:CCR4-NOT transcriptional regulation complex NOT5 subunit
MYNKAKTRISQFKAIVRQICMKKKSKDALSQAELIDERLED